MNSVKMNNNYDDYYCMMEFLLLRCNKTISLSFKRYTHTVPSIVSQLDKCLKFKSVRGDENDCILYKITPRNAMNFRH